MPIPASRAGRSSSTRRPATSIGRFGAVLLVKAMGGNPKGKVAIVSAQPTAANQNLWIEAFKDEMKKYTDVEIVDTVYGYDNEQKAFDATVALTTKYPDLAGIFAPTCPGLPAVARALESVNKGHGKIKVSGNCVPSITVQIHARRHHRGLLPLGSDQARLRHLLRGQEFGRGQDHGQGRRILHDRRRASGRAPTRSVEDGQIITGEPLQFTAENYKDYNF